MSTNPDAPSLSGHYLTFRLGDELFAINVFQVREILDLTPITKVPTAPEHLRGVVNVRGKAIPVVDLRRRFGLPKVTDTVHTRIVVLELELDGAPCVVGGQADSVHEVIELDAGQIDPPPSLASRWRAETVRGMARRGDDFIMLLDVGRVFDVEELASAVDDAPVAA
jgi:purine-binding chemotaxis protein CheW